MAVSEPSTEQKPRQTYSRCSKLSDCPTRLLTTGRPKFGSGFPPRFVLTFTPRRPIQRRTSRRSARFRPAPAPPTLLAVLFGTASSTAPSARRKRPSDLPACHHEPVIPCRPPAAAAATTADSPSSVARFPAGRTARSQAVLAFHSRFENTATRFLDATGAAVVPLLLLPAVKLAVAAPAVGREVAATAAAVVFLLKASLVAAPPPRPSSSPAFDASPSLVSTSRFRGRGRAANDCKGKGTGGGGGGGSVAGSCGGGGKKLSLDLVDEEAFRAQADGWRLVVDRSWPEYWPSFCRAKRVVWVFLACLGLVGVL